MPAKIQEEVLAKAPPEEGTVRPFGTVRAAAAAAAEAYAPNEVEKHAQAILDAWVAQLKEKTRVYARQVMMQAAQVHPGGEGAETAFYSGPIAAPYSWFDLVMAGPFQVVAGPDGPFQPNKVIRVDEWSFMLGALWRNPLPVLFDPTSPSAAALTAAYDFKVWFEAINLTTVEDGPDFEPFLPLPSPIGGGPVDGFFALIPPDTFPAPASGKPHLYEINLTADVTGPGAVTAGLPFSGFATWIWDPDLELGFSPLPWFTPRPEQGPHWHYDVPARFLVHI